MKITEFLKGLDEERLELAVQKAQELLDAKRAEKQVRLWQVESPGFELDDYTDEQYPQAVEALCRAIQEEAKRHPLQRIRCSLVSIRMPESEYLKDYKTDTK